MLSVLHAAVLTSIPTFLTFEWSSSANASSAPEAAHHDFGYAFGTKFSALITKRFAAKAMLAKFVRLAQTAEGAALYQSFVELHWRKFPLSMAELTGLSEGSGIQFEEIFMQNIVEEFGLCAAQLPGGPPYVERVDACSDLMVCEEGFCAVGHNEDNSIEDLGTVVLTKAAFGTSEFYAAVYAGELPSGAFGFSRSGGFGFTLNYVAPKDAACPGVGRGFVSRELLRAASMAEALHTITSVQMGSGHNYQLFSLGSAAQIVNVEVAPRGLYAVRPIRAPFFHANQYQTLRVPMIVGNSSLHRLARAAQLPPPKSNADILHSLGDQADHAWPIYHDNASHAAGDLSDWTMCVRHPSDRTPHRTYPTPCSHPAHTLVICLHFHILPP